MRSSAILFIALLAALHPVVVEAGAAPADRAAKLETIAGEGARVVAHFGLRDGRELLGVQRRAPSALSPSTAQLILVERSGDELRPIAQEVAHAAWAPDGTILYLQRGVTTREGLLLEANGEERRTLLRDLADFAVSPKGELAVVRRLPEYRFSIALHARDGRLVRTLLIEDAPLSTPFFTPDGRTLLYVSGRTGLLSLFALPTEGGEPRQLTNVSVRRIGPDYLSPPLTRSSVKFLDAARLRYEVRGGTVEVDVAAGKAWEVRQ